MDAWGCERNWAKTVATGLPGHLCFGVFSRSDYVPFWCAVALATVAVYVAGLLRAAKKGAKAEGRLPWLRCLLAKLGGRPRGGAVRPELEAGLLEDAPDALASPGPGAPVPVPSAEMERACQALGTERGLEAASLAVLLAVQQRRRYGSCTTAAVVCGARGRHPKEVSVELETPRMSFRALLAAVDGALQKLHAEGAEPVGAPAEAPEVVFAWEQQPWAPGQWAARRAEPGFIAVQGSSLEEARSFQTLFKACAANVDADVWQLPLVPEASLQRVQAWGTPVKDFAKYREPSGGRIRPIPEILAAPQADPKADAVRGDGFCISYGELAARATAVVRAVEQNSDPSQKRVVVIYMGRGEAIGPAFLGVLQAGCQVVPVDVHWPSDRVRQVAEDSEAALALTEPASAVSWLALGPGVPKSLLVDASFFQTYAQGSAANSQPRACSLDQESPAIVLFTSGSTGRPKGIVLSHGYLTALIVGVAESKRMTAQTRTLCYHSPTWMPFLDYLFCPLIMGGCCLYFPESDTHVVKPAELRAFGQRHGATNAGFVPAMLDILLEEGLPKSFTDIGVGGAAVPAELCTRVTAALPPGGVLYTGYSGTEQGDVTQIQMREEADVKRGTADKGFMGAGRPHAGQRCAVLDEGFSVVGPEGVGEISVSGPGLAAGYLKLPEKTAETFLVSCGALDGARTVRTGDLGKWTGDGNLKVVGRRDSMVKVRGARIELGEVEAAVASHPGVKATVVTVYQDQLLAYVVPAVPATLRDHCKERLVAYMVPHIFEGLEELPRLPNGKINKKALPEPQVRTDGVETVMELDSLGQMRKFTRRAASEDRVLDNVRAILIGVVIQSHATPVLLVGAAMLDVANRPLQGTWGPVQLFLLNITRGGGWSSLAFLNGFDDTRSMRPYGLTYREPLFLVLWLLLDFNWSMWYLPVFVYMRATFCAMHWLGLEKLHILVASQFFILMPAFVDLYVGWQPSTGHDVCPSQCFCPWQSWPYAQTIAYYLSGWWVAGSDPVGHSMVGHALIFIPCYWIGFYSGGRIFSVLTKVADEPKWWRRVLVAGGVLLLYCFMYTAGHPLNVGFDDRCGNLWTPDGTIVWQQILMNIVYFVMNLSMSLTYVVFIAAAVPVHLKYLAKNCFPALIFSAYTPCLLDFPAMALELRKVVAPAISPSVEIAWSFAVSFLYELVVGAAFATAVPPIARAVMGLSRRMFG